MALILKSSRLMSRLIAVASQANLPNVSKNPLLIPWKNFIVTSAQLKRGYATAAAPKVVTSDTLERSIYLLDLDARNKHRVFKKDIEEILTAIQHCKNVSYANSLLLLKCCSSLCLLETPAERVKLAKKVWNTLSTLDIQFDIFHYNALLNVYLENGYKFSPQEFLKVLDENRIKPNLITYQGLLKAFGQQGNITGASSILEKIKKAGLPIDDNIFNSLIYCHCQADDIEEAMNIMEFMKQKGIKPNSESYLHLLCAHAKIGNMDEIRKILDECEKKRIFLLNKHLLEVVYTLAVNGYEEYIDEILQKTNKNAGYNFQAVQLIHRLLHKKLDSIAMKIYDTLKKSNIESDTRNYGQFLVDHYVRYRSENDLVQLCQKLEEKGLVSSSLNYALRKTLEQKDIQKSFQLIRAMKKQGLPIRSHYFWPLIITASQRGNYKVLEVLKEMRNLHVPRCRKTVCKVLYPSYKFGSNWEKDLDDLKKCGIDNIQIFDLLLESFIVKRQLSEAEALAKSKPIVKNCRYIIPRLVDCLKSEPGSEKAIVNILYGLLHDINVRHSANAEEENTSLDEEGASADDRTDVPTMEKFVNIFISKLVLSCTEDVVLNVLKSMLETKMAISSEAAANILATFPSSDIKNLVDKLQASKIELDEEIISKKRKKDLDAHQILRKLSFRGQLNEAEKVWEELGDQATFTDYVDMILMYIQENEIDKALKLCEKFPVTDDKATLEKIQFKYLFIIKELSNIEDPDVVKKAIAIGTEKGIIIKNMSSFLIRGYLLRNELDKAIEAFEKFANESSVASIYPPLVEHLIKCQDWERTQKVVDIVMNIEGNAKSWFLVIFYLAHWGKTKQATKLFKSRRCQISRDQFKWLCDRFYDVKSETCFENMLTVMKGTCDLNKSLLYNTLLKLYIESKETDKILNLCAEVKEDNTPVDQTFLNDVSTYLDAVEVPNPFNIDNKEKENSETTEGISKTVESSEELIHKPLNQRQALTLVYNLASHGELEKVLKLCEDFKLTKELREICYNFVSSGFFNEYLRFVEKISESDPDNLNVCFLVSAVTEHCKTDPTVEEKYKSILMTAYQRSNSDSFPMILFLINLSLGRLKEAEEIYDQYLSAFPNLGKQIVNCNNKSTSHDIVKTLEKSEKLKSLSGLSWADLYIREIKKGGKYLTLFLWEVHVMKNTDLALEYLRKTVDNGYGNLLNKSLLLRLKNELKSKDEEFPYPHLLMSNPKGKANSEV